MVTSTTLNCGKGFNARAADSPRTSAIFFGMSSGLKKRGSSGLMSEANGGAAFLGLANHLVLRLAFKKALQSGAYDVVILGQENPNQPFIAHAGTPLLPSTGI